MCRSVSRAGVSLNIHSFIHQGVSRSSGDIAYRWHCTKSRDCQVRVRGAPSSLYGRKEGRKKGNILFHDAFSTFYLRLYRVGHTIKDHSDSERGNPLPPLRGLLFRLAARVLLYAPSHSQDNTYNGLCYTSRGALAGTRNLEQPLSYISLLQM